MRRTTVLAAVLAVAFAALSSHGASERNLSWLQGKCPNGGAMVHQYGGSNYQSASDIYLYEVSSGSRTKIGRGCQPEFSPDAQLVAWLDGTTAKGCPRSNTSDVHVIATGVATAAGVHWVSNEEVVVVQSNHWYRIHVGSGAKTAETTLDRLGTGGSEIDVKYRGSDNWSYVTGTTWKYVNGASGSIQTGSTGGHCSCSLSPDGKSATGLHDGHDECSLTQMMSGGTSGALRRTLSDCSSKGFDNHRWSSNDPRFVVAQYECENLVGVWEVGTNDVYLFGNCTGETYGDFTLGSATDPWPGGGTVDPSLTCDVGTVEFSYTINDPAPPNRNVRVYTPAGSLSGLSAGDDAGWLSVSMSASSGTEANVINAVDPSGLTAGTYTATVTVTSTDAGTITYQVSLDVAAYVAPPACVLTAPNGGETYVVGQQISITWEANEDSVDRIEIFISPNDGEDWYAVTGTASVQDSDPEWEDYPWTIPETIEGVSLVSGNCLVLVQDYNEGTGIGDQSEAAFSIMEPGALSLKLNCGGGTAVSGWDDPSSYASGGTPFEFSDAFSTSGVANAAPAEVYKTCRHRVRNVETGYSYVVPSVPDGAYTMRFHFGDESGAGARSIDVSVNGTKLIDNLDVAGDAGGTNMALAIEHQVTVTGGAGVTIAIDDDRADPADVFINGIEILSTGGATVTGMAGRTLSPNSLVLTRMPGSLMITTGLSQARGRIVITDLTGRTLAQFGTHGGSRCLIPTDQLATGLYTVHATLEGHTTSRTFSVSH